MSTEPDIFLLPGCDDKSCSANGLGTGIAGLNFKTVKIEEIKRAARVTQERIQIVIGENSQ